MNCIYNATLNGVSLKDSDLYVYGLPICSDCAKGVIQVGIKRVFMCYPNNINDKWQASFEDTKKMFDEAGIRYNTYVNT
jgi:dCMP deaminase